MPSHPRSSLSPLPLVLAPLALAGLLLAPAPADACGGTFCDGGPQVMPVDQTGENILFWIDHSGTEPHTEAHIQIQYQGAAQNFAWIIPVQAVPEVLVGNQALFDNLLAATVPTFTLSRNVEDCGDDEEPVGLCAARGGLEPDEIDVGSADEAGDGFEDTGEEPGPDILDRGFAGAFEYVVLTGSSVQEVVDWLDMAGYAQDDEAPPILQEYLDDGFVFVAVKLRGGAGVEDIHPLAIRYPGVEPCVPIKLTRIAAVDDMAIRTFFLGAGRAAPQNWPHVVLNPVAFDWLNRGSNYLEVVALAIDEAGGRAFTTEYAGTDDVVSTTGLLGADWNSGAFLGIEPALVYDMLRLQDLGLICEPGTENCSFAHPQVEPLLMQYLPPPDGLDPYEFWTHLDLYADQIDATAWSGPGFAADFEARIVVPGQHAIEMLASATTLTRMLTLISPHEMTEDPLFFETELNPVTRNYAATVTRACEGNDWVDFMGFTVALTDAGLYPDIEGMPSAQLVQQIPAMGAPQNTTDNTALIHDLVDGWNAGKLGGPEPGCAVTRLNAEALLSMLALFGIAWTTRRRIARLA